jgi:hypothetical protein
MHSFAFASARVKGCLLKRRIAVFRIAPSNVPQQLVDRLVHVLLPTPKFAFGNKGVRTLVSNENIRLAASIERLARSVTLIMAV